MLPIQPRRFHVRDEKLAAVGVRTRIRHRKRPWSMLVRIPFGLVLELVARPTAARAGRIAALHHEIRDHSMENRTVVALLLSQEYEIVNGLGRVFGKQLANNLATRRLKRSRVLFGSVDRHLGRG